MPAPKFASRPLGPPRRAQIRLMRKLGHLIVDSVHPDVRRGSIYAADIATITQTLGGPCYHLRPETSEFLPVGLLPVTHEEDEEVPNPTLSSSSSGLQGSPIDTPRNTPESTPTSSVESVEPVPPRGIWMPTSQMFHVHNLLRTPGRWMPTWNLTSTPAPLVTVLAEVHGEITSYSPHCEDATSADSQSPQRPTFRHPMANPYSSLPLI